MGAAQVDHEAQAQLAFAKPGRAGLDKARRRPGCRGCCTRRSPRGPPGAVQPDADAAAGGRDVHDHRRNPQACSSRSGCRRPSSVAAGPIDSDHPLAQCGQHGQEAVGSRRSGFDHQHPVSLAAGFFWHGRAGPHRQPHRPRSTATGACRRRGHAGRRTAPPPHPADRGPPGCGSWRRAPRWPLPCPACPPPRPPPDWLQAAARAG